MSKSMDAVFYDGTPEPVVRQAPVPEPGAGEVLIKVLCAGICGTDLSILSGKHPRAQAPLVLGHEVAGRVEQSEPDSGFQEGDLVTVVPTLSCGHCGACRRGQFHVCRNLRFYGIDAPGGFAEYIAVKADRVVLGPPGMAPELLVLAEPLSVAVHSVRMSGIKYGDSVCVIGGGPIGLLTALVARKTTPSKILVSEPELSRRDVAESLGFEVVDPSSQSLSEIAVDRTDGNGFDVVFESAGSQPAIRDATKIVGSRGKLIQVSMPKEDRSISIVDITFKEIQMIGVRAYESSDFNHALAFLLEDPDLFGPIRSSPFTLTDAGAAFEAARNGNQGLRVIFRIGD